MKVKIISCNRPTYWYYDQVGREFEVYDYNKSDYKVVSDNICGSYILKSDCEIIPDVQNEFKKGKYIVLTCSVVNPRQYKQNHCYKQIKDSDYLKTEIDSVGSKTNGWPYLRFDNKTTWREALPHEIEAYDKAGGPVDCGNIVDEDEWCMGDIIQFRNKELQIINETKDNKLIFLEMGGRVKIGYGDKSYYISQGWKKVHPKIKVTQDDLIQCYLKANNLTSDKIEVI